MSVTQTERLFNGHRVVTLTPDTPRGNMIWFHGGGWMIELGEDALAWGRDLAEATQLILHFPDYPLAREFAYPKSNEWCTTYWRHMLTETKGACYLGGDSAGAHLALCCLPAGFPLKALFIYAVTTLLPIRNVGSWAAFQKRSWSLSPRLMDYFYDAYCPDHTARFGASPLEQLSAIPPTLLITAKNDILADQQTAFAQRFNAQQIVYEGATHIFLSREDGITYRQRALEDAKKWLA